MIPSPPSPACAFAVRTHLALWLLLLGAPALNGQSVPLAEIQVRADPAEARVRPLESLVVQLRVYGHAEEDGEEARKVRLPMDGARFSLGSGEAGWISKPFRYQGAEDEPFHGLEGAGIGGRLLGRTVADFLLKDSVLYTAPPTPGEYEITAELEGKKATLRLIVDSQAPSRIAAQGSPPPPDEIGLPGPLRFRWRLGRRQQLECHAAGGRAGLRLLRGHGDQHPLVPGL
jgi:hypothetical protein